MDVEALKLAAVDAYMRSEGYSVHDDHTYSRSDFNESSHIGSDGKGTVTTYPQGEGGALHTELDFSGQFADVRARVDSALYHWQDDRLPHPAALNEGMLTAQKAVIALNVGSQTSFGGALGGFIKSISDNSPHLRGAAMDAFNNSFVNQLPAVISNHGCLAAVNAEAWSAEKEIWTKAREDLDTHVEQATAALHTYAHTEDHSDIKFALALTGAAIAGASALVTGGATLPFALATAGITALSATNDYVGELSVARGGASYEELMSAFEGGLDDIDEGITKQETLVMEGLQNASDVFENHRALFDLTPRVSDDHDGKWGDEQSLFKVKDASGMAIVLPGQPIIDSLVSGMENLAHGLGDANPKIIAGGDDHGLLGESARDVGLVYGVSIWLWITCYNNSASVRDLRWDVDNSSRMLQAVIRDFRDADDASQRSLDRLRTKLAVGSGERPWG